MRSIFSAIKTAFGQSDNQKQLSRLRTITYAPAAGSEARAAEIRTARELTSISPGEHEKSFSGEQDKPDDDFLELKNICEAIGLDPRELLGDPAPSDATRGQTPAFRESAGTSFRTAAAPDARKPVYNASDMAAILASLKLRLLKLRLAPDDIAETQAEIDTAVAQLFSPRPKEDIIAASVKTIVSILNQAGPGALTVDVETSLDKLRTFLKQLND